jgi:phage/plasmid-like protein (TIGR03299 family)
VQCNLFSNNEAATMAHLFNSGLFFGQSAWHGLGVTLPADSPVRYSIDDAITISGLDWSVETRPVCVDGREIAGHKAIVRSDSGDVLGVVGDRYHPLQNRDQFDWFTPFLDSGLCQIETCGALKSGALVWVLAKLNRTDAEITADDKVRKYLLLTSSHDGSRSTSVGFCPIRVVCWNTLSAGLRDERSTLLKVKHTASQNRALRTIRETINLVDETFEATAAQYRTLIACGVDRAVIRLYVKKVLELTDDETNYSSRQRNILDSIVDLCVNGVGNDGRTVWSAYNGVTQYVTHFYGRSADSRLRANWYGEGKRISDRAFSVALQLAS